MPPGSKSDTQDETAWKRSCINHGLFEAEVPANSTLLQRRRGSLTVANNGRSTTQQQHTSTRPSSTPRADPANPAPNAENQAARHTRENVGRRENQRSDSRPPVGEVPDAHAGPVRNPVLTSWSRKQGIPTPDTKQQDRHRDAAPELAFNSARVSRATITGPLDQPMPQTERDCFPTTSVTSTISLRHQRRSRTEFPIAAVNRL